MKTNWTRIFTPTIILIILLVSCYIFDSFSVDKSQGWNMLAVIMLLPFLIVLLVLDIILKVIRRIKTFVIWIVEFALIALTIFYWLL
jgi:hypothetical protein